LHWTKESDPRYGTVVVKGGNSKSVSMASLRLVTRVMNVVVVSTVTTSLTAQAFQQNVQFNWRETAYAKLHVRYIQYG
jgi:hypothetical protein